MCKWCKWLLIVGTKPLSEPMLAYGQLEPWKQISVKFESEFYNFHLRKCIWKCCLPEWRLFEIWIGILSFSFKKMHLKMLSARMAAILSWGIWVKTSVVSQGIYSPNFVKSRSCVIACWLITSLWNWTCAPTAFPNSFPLVKHHVYTLSYVNTLRTEQYDRHFTDDIFQLIFLCENC